MTALTDPTGWRGAEEISAGGFSAAVVAETPRAAKRRFAERLTPRRFLLTNARMPPASPLCPYLPAPRAELDWRALHRFRDSDRGPEFYFACLEYGQTLWQRRFAARALLCLDRAMGADLRGDEPVLESWPMPYAAMAWLIAHTPDELLVGNPRVHFQHYADRMNEPRREQRRWRAWACWALTRVVRPDLPNDPKHWVTEPALGEIEAGLRAAGHSGEARRWENVLRDADKRPGS